MIDIAMKYLCNKLNERLKNYPVEDQEQVLLASVIKDNGESNAKEAMPLMLVNVEEEKILKAQLQREQRNVNDIKFANPEIRLNLLVLLGINSSEYYKSLVFLSRAITFFQGNAFFNKTTPGANPETMFPVELEQLSVELYSLSIEQQNQLWASLGAKYIPSVVYKVRLVTIADDTFDKKGSAIRIIDNDLHKI